MKAKRGKCPDLNPKGADRELCGGCYSVIVDGKERWIHPPAVAKDWRVFEGAKVKK